jgi:hypothetical protein
MAVFELNQYHIQWVIWKKLDRGFPIFDNNPKNSCDITNSEFWSWKKFSELMVTKNKFWSTILEERLNYLSILYRESNITQSLLYDEAIKEYVTKNLGQRTLLSCIGQLSIENIIFFMDFLCLWYLSACLNL